MSDLSSQWRARAVQLAILALLLAAPAASAQSPADADLKAISDRVVAAATRLGAELRG